MRSIKTSKWVGVLLVYRVIPVEHGSCKGGILIHERIEAVAQHLGSDRHHLVDLRRLVKRIDTDDVQQTIRDRCRVIPDSFEIVYDSSRGRDKAQVTRNRLVQRETLDDLVVNIELELIDSRFDER